MKLALLSLAALMFAACQGNTQEKSQGKVELKTQQDSVSYSIGMNIAKNFKTQQVDVNPEVVGQAMKDVLSGATPMLTDSQVTECLSGLQSRMMASQAERMKAAGEKNKKEGEAFLAENKKKEGWKTTASGLQYKVLKVGHGPKPKENQTVTVNYRGSLINGLEFDNSYKRGQPATQPVTQFIKGWIEALEMMPVGSKWQLAVPADLAYGDRGAGQMIGPQSVLLFDIELLGVK
jgi:FKBP-type peptidyl-prolyl cis-trans isomerase FklB